MYQRISLLILTMVLALGLSACKNEIVVTESEKANALFEKAFQLSLDRSPEFQTYLGMRKNGGEWDNLSDEFAQEEIEIAKKTLKELKGTIDYDALDEATTLSYDLFKATLEDNIDAFKYRFHDYPVNQMFGVHADAPAFLINIHQIKDVVDAENYISRLNNLSLYFDQLIEGLDKRQSMGVLPPLFVFAKVLDDSKNVITGQPFDDSEINSTLYEDFKGKLANLTADDTTKERLLKSATQALLDNVQPAYKKLIAKLEAQQNVAITDDGVWKLPDGENFYNYQLKKITTTDLNAEQIHQIGLKEVARIHGEMREIMKQVGFEGDLLAFFKFMREDPQFYYPNTNEGREGYLETATAIIEDMKGDLDDMFITKPKADIIVKKVEAFREKSAGSAFYQSPAIDGSRPGIYYANLYNMETMPTYQREALAYHEGIPGHHMQLSIAQELQEVPMFRKFGNYTAYIEGWGLYSEYLPKEFGYYKDPYSDFGRLAMELWRACRLVVDTGIHVKRWTREQGIEYYSNNTPDSLQDGIRMVERHIVMPGQATAYKIGMMKILELRETAKEALGDKFDIRQYHEQVLTNGALPLDVLEQRVMRWISSINPQYVESAKANAFFEQYFQDTLSRSPEFQSYLGIKDNADKWDDLSEEFAKKEHEIAKNTLAELRNTLDANLLDEATALSYQLLENGLKDEIEDYQYRLHDYPVNQMFGVHADVAAFLINVHQINDTKDAQDYIARLNNIHPLFDQLIIGLKMRQEQGIMPPKFVFAKVLDDSKNLISGRPFDQSDEDNTLLADFKSKVAKLDIDDDARNGMIDSATKALATNVKPAYTKLIALLKTQQAAATTDDGAWKLPDGASFFNNRLQRITTTDLTSDKIHEIGLKEVDRIHNEMRAIKDKVGFKGDLQAFFEFMREDEQFYYEDSVAGRKLYIDKATGLIETMKESLDGLFITKPKADLMVKQVEAFREKSAGKAFYQRPAPDGSRPGIYYANMYDIKSMPTYQMEALAYHEGIPGHHMQLSIAQELKDVPKFRKFGGYTAYIEGWGLYSEYLPKELNFYSDPYSDFGRLAMELWRACRLVVDTGIHAKQWTREQGIEYYTTNTPNAVLDGVKMVERHIVMPGQATAYKVGMLKILELRDMAKKALGEKFDIREFHDQILIRGALPLNVLEDRINDWVASQ